MEVRQGSQGVQQGRLQHRVTWMVAVGTQDRQRRSGLEDYYNISGPWLFTNVLILIGGHSICGYKFIGPNIIMIPIGVNRLLIQPSFIFLLLKETFIEWETSTGCSILIDHEPLFDWVPYDGRENRFIIRNRISSPLQC